MIKKEKIGQLTKFGRINYPKNEIILLVSFKHLVEKIERKQFNE